MQVGYVLLVRYTNTTYIMSSCNIGRINNIEHCILLTALTKISKWCHKKIVQCFCQKMTITTNLNLNFLQNFEFLMTDNKKTYPYLIHLLYENNRLHRIMLILH